MKKFKQYIAEANKVTIDVDWSPSTRKESGLIQNAKDSLGVQIKPKSNGTATISGSKRDIKVLLKSKAYFGYSESEIEELFPELK